MKVSSGSKQETKNVSRPTAKAEVAKSGLGGAKKADAPSTASALKGDSKLKSSSEKSFQAAKKAAAVGAQLTGPVGPLASGPALTVNIGNAGNSGNEGNTGNAGNAGNAGNEGNTGNAGNAGNDDYSGNAGNTGTDDYSGNAGNAN